MYGLIIFIFSDTRLIKIFLVEIRRTSLQILEIEHYIILYIFLRLFWIFLSY